MDIVEIANSGFIKIGAEQIMAFTDDSKEGRLASLRFRPDLRTVLRWHPWNTVVERVVLAPLLTIPPYDFTHWFQLPSDMLRLLEVQDQDDYRIEGRRLLSDSTTENIKYIKDPGDSVNELDQLCAEAIATYFAWDVSYAITQSRTLKEQMFGEFQAIFRHAKSVDAKEDPALLIGADQWVDSRTNPASFQGRTNR